MPDSSKTIKIGVKFCGNCNPSWDTGVFFEKLKTRGGKTFVGWQDRPYEMLLVLNGCKKGCAATPDFNGPVITVDDTFVTDGHGNKYIYDKSETQSAVNEIVSLIEKTQA